MGMEGEASLMGSSSSSFSFFWQGNQGTRVLREKCKTKPERWDRKTTKQKKIPQSRKVGDTESQVGVLGKGSDRVPTRSQSASSEDMAMLGSVTEWVLAGQQTAICKHHEGKHQSTLDFFIYNFLLL